MLSFRQIHIDEYVFHPYFLSLISCLLFIVVYILMKSRYQRKKTLPPSPPKLPIIGNLHQLRPLIHRSLQSLGRKYGPVMLLHFGSKPVIVVQSASSAKEILKTHDLVYASKPKLRNPSRLLFDGKDITTAPYGEYWRKSKSICVLQLLSSKKVQSFSFIREEETDILMKKIKSCSTPVNLSELFTTLLNDVISRSAFGKKYSEEEDGKKYILLMKELSYLLGCLSIGDFIPSLWWINRVNGFDSRVDRVAKEVDDFLNQIVRQEHDKKNIAELGGTRESTFLEILLDIYKNNTTGVSIDRDNIKAIILDMFLGGTDTTSATLEWAMTELLLHPKVMMKLQKEIREILKDKQDIITENDLEKMHYLKAVVKETLRYHTIVMALSREAREDTQVMGYEVEAGTMILINGWAIGRDPAFWDEPDEFKPERFLNSTIDFQGLDYELIPFGAGRRRCPGISFSVSSIQLVLANLMQKFDWELPQGMKTEDLDVLELPGVSVIKKNRLFAVASKCYF